MCTRCNWVFFNESAPPYVVQAVGILIFLVGCIVLNFVLQDKLDRLMKTLPSKLPGGRRKDSKQEVNGFQSGYAVRLIANDGKSKKVINLEKEEPLLDGVRKKRPSMLYRRKPSEVVYTNDTPTSETMHEVHTDLPIDTDSNFINKAFGQRRPRRSLVQVMNARMSLDIINLLEGAPGSAGRGGGGGHQNYRPTSESNPLLFSEQVSANDDMISLALPPSGTPDTAETPIHINIPLPESIQSNSSLFRGSDRSPLDTPAYEKDVIDYFRRTTDSKDLEPDSTPVNSFTSTNKDLKSPSNTDLISSYATHGTADFDNSSDVAIKSNMLSVVVNDSTDVVDCYKEHSTSGNKQFNNDIHNQRSEPLLDMKELSDSTNTNSGSLQTHMCAACGMDSDIGRVKHGNWKCMSCASKRRKANPVLTSPILVDHDILKEMAYRGNLGFFGEISAVSRRQSNTVQALVGFRNCAVWMPSELFSVSERDSFDLSLAKSEFYTPPSIRATSPQQCSTWLTLAKGLGYIITEVDVVESFTAIQLQKAVNTWIDCSRLQVISKQWSGGKYARIAEQSEFKKASGDRWQKWWKDFELCVGTILSVGRDSNNNYYGIISFQGSATLVLPIAALLHCNEAEHDSEYLITPQPVSRRTMMAVFVASAPPLLAAKGIFLMTFFVVSIVSALSDGHGGRANNHSKWEAYEEVYFKLFNSGYPTLMADCGSVTFFFWYSFNPTFHQFAAGVGVPVMVALGLSLLVSLPGLITHALPMVVLYLWIWVPIGCVLGLITKYVLFRFQPQAPAVDAAYEYDLYYHMKYHRLYIIKSGAFYLGCRFVAEFIAVLFVQTSFNYGIFIYDKHPYLQTILDDVNGRKFACLWEMGLKLASLLW